MNAVNWKEELVCVLRNPRVIFAQDLAWPMSRIVPDHRHDCYQLDYFYKGTGRATIAGCEYHVRPGDLFVINPNVEHDFQAAREVPMEGISIKYDMRMGAKGPTFPSYVGNLGMLSRNQQREMEHYLRKACEEANVGQEEHQQLAAALLSVFFLLLLRYLHDVEQLASADPEMTQCQRVLECVRQHYSRQITLADLARIAGLEPRYLCRKFSKEFGMPPMAALTHERILAAKQLLSHTKLPICEVGVRVGYQDTYHFSKRFKEMTGISPKRYRLLASSASAESRSLLLEQGSQI